MKTSTHSTRASSRLLALACLSAGLLTGCPADPVPASDGGPPASDGGPPAPTPDAAGPSAALAAADWSAFAARWWDTVCTRWTRCTGLPRAQCAHDHFGLDHNLALLGALGAAIARGEVEYDPDQAAACLDAARAEERCDAPLFGDPACAAAFVGTLPLGAECEISDACGPDAWCELTARCQGVCVARQAAGAPCSSSTGPECGQGLKCLEATDQCAAAPGDGDPCVADYDCQPGHHCQRPDGVCRVSPLPAVAGEGELCDTGAAWRTLGLPRDAAAIGPTRLAVCAEGSTCVYDFERGNHCVVGAAPDEPCSAMRPCAPGAACITADGEARCRVQRDLGEACAAGERCAGGSCLGGRCQLPAVPGAGCSGARECPGSDCVGGVCQAAPIDCGRIPRRTGCADAAECNPVDGVDTRCEGGSCRYRPLALRLRLGEVYQPQVPETGQWFTGWPDAAGFALGADEDGLWLAPALADGPHPTLPAMRLAPARGDPLVAPTPDGPGALYFYGARDSGLPPARLWLPDPDDPCRWSPAPITIDLLRVEFERYPEEVSAVEVVFVVEQGTGLTLDGEPVDALFDARGVDGAGFWQLPATWDFAEDDGDAPPAVFDPGDDAPVQICP